MRLPSTPTAAALRSRPLFAMTTVANDGRKRAESSTPDWGMARAGDKQVISQRAYPGPSRPGPSRVAWGLSRCCRSAQTVCIRHPLLACRLPGSQNAGRRQLRCLWFSCGPPSRAKGGTRVGVRLSQPCRSSQRLPGVPEDCSINRVLGGRAGGGPACGVGSARQPQVGQHELRRRCGAIWLFLQHCQQLCDFQ